MICFLTFLACKISDLFSDKIITQYSVTASSPTLIWCDEELSAHRLRSSNLLNRLPKPTAPATTGAAPTPTRWASWRAWAPRTSTRRTAATWPPRTTPPTRPRERPTPPRPGKPTATALAATGSLWIVETGRMGRRSLQLWVKHLFALCSILFCGHGKLLDNFFAIFQTWYAYRDLIRDF